MFIHDIHERSVWTLTVLDIRRMERKLRKRSGRNRHYGCCMWKKSSSKRTWNTVSRKLCIDDVPFCRFIGKSTFLKQPLRKCTLSLNCFSLEQKNTHCVWLIRQMNRWHWYFHVSYLYVWNIGNCIFSGTCYALPSAFKERRACLLRRRPSLINLIDGTEIIDIWCFYFKVAFNTASTYVCSHTLRY